MKTEPTEAYGMIEEDWYAVPYMGTDYPQDPDIVVDKKDVYEIAKKAFEEGQSSPKIKQLEWKEDYGCIMAETPFLKYLVLIIGGKAGLCFDGADEFLKFRTVDEAKAAAQRDFEKRINECLE